MLLSPTKKILYTILFILFAFFTMFYFPHEQSHFLSVYAQDCGEYGIEECPPTEDTPPETSNINETPPSEYYPANEVIPLPPPEDYPANGVPGSDSTAEVADPVIVPDETEPSNQPVKKDNEGACPEKEEVNLDTGRCGPPPTLEQIAQDGETWTVNDPAFLSVFGYPEAGSQEQSCIYAQLEDQGSCVGKFLYCLYEAPYCGDVVQEENKVLGNNCTIDIDRCSADVGTEGLDFPDLQYKRTNDTPIDVSTCPTTVSNGPDLINAVNCYKNALAGGKLNLTEGTFLVKEKISVPSNLIIAGAGMDQTIIKIDTNTDEPFKDDALMANDSSHGQENIILRDFTLQGDGNRVGNSCCYGLKLQNITNAFVVNIASNNWGIDGIYLGSRNKKSGAKNVRITGSVINNNGRNGISVVDAQNSVIDSSELSGNNANELVSAIDLEPDNGNTVSNVHIFNNIITKNKNNSIQLWPNPEEGGKGVVKDNYICDNSIQDNKGQNEVYVHKSVTGTKFSGCNIAGLEIPASF